MFPKVSFNYSIHFDLCTDSVKSMTGKSVGVVACIKSASKMCTSTLCIFHTQALAAEDAKIIEICIRQCSTSC
jgi:hypothetical protein